MARLNEAPAPADPVELLRRKYIRQNKDIARMNSAQAVRIRNLENEVAHLLAENLELRGRIISQEVQPQRSRNFINHVGEIRSQLDAKLREITDLVTKLDRPVKEPRSSTGTRLPKARRRTSEERAMMMEALAEQEGRLPAILENKSYPRRTMDQEEIAAIISTNEYIESPDIGPPPVSHFINEDPVKIDLPPASNMETEEPAGLDPVLSINLEQRRKRRDASGGSETRRQSEFSSVEEEKKEIPQPIKSGAKRKFNVSDEQEVEREARPVAISPDDFKYTRRAAEVKPQPNKEMVVPEKPVARVQREVAIARARSKERAASNMSTNPRTTTPLVTRRALEPKTSNTDVANSPKKLTKPPILDDGTIAGKLPGIKDTTATERLRSRSEAPTTMQVAVEPVIVTSVEILPEPETPAAPEDLFSPTSSAPSTARQLSRDTPPPQEIGSDGEGHRPSRRARASVSYAEPNLRDKMRRPTKDLVDAVTGEGKGNRQSSFKLEEEPQTAVKIKPEPEEDDAWKRKLPAASSVTVYSNSPLSSKAVDQAPISEIPQRRRRGSQLYESNEEGRSKTGPSSAISALIATSRKVKPEALDPNPLKKAFDNLEQKMADMDIYEFNDNDEAAPRPRASRSQGTAETSDFAASSRVAASSRRRQSTLGVGMSAVEKEQRRRESGLQRSASTSQVLKDTAKEAEVDSSKSERSERLGARRRSMML